ncbi:unnamed protein product, partial [Acanthocheilonema viteae]
MDTVTPGTFISTKCLPTTVQLEGNASNVAHCIETKRKNSTFFRNVEFVK